MGHLNSLFGGDNWAKCSTVMYPVGLLVACFPWWIGSSYGQRFWGHYQTAYAQVPFKIWTTDQILILLILAGTNKTRQQKPRPGAGREGWEKEELIFRAVERQPPFWAQKEAGRQGARRYLCSTWLRSKMTADGCCSDIMDEQMWRQLSKCSNTIPLSYSLSRLSPFLLLLLFPHSLLMDNCLSSSYTFLCTARTNK